MIKQPDPLNLPTWRKNAAIISVCFCESVCKLKKPVMLTRPSWSTRLSSRVDNWRLNTSIRPRVRWHQSTYPRHTRYLQTWRLWRRESESSSDPSRSWRATAMENHPAFDASASYQRNQQLLPCAPLHFNWPKTSPTWVRSFGMDRWLLCCREQIFGYSHRCSLHTGSWCWSGRGPHPTDRAGPCLHSPT